MILAQDKKIYINEVIDNRLNSLSLAISFIILGLLLTVSPAFLGNEVATSAVRWVFVVFGVAGFFSSFGDKKSNIKGTDDLAAGVLVCAIAVLCYVYIPAPFNGIPALVILLFGIYELTRGLLFLIYTTKRTYSSADANAESDGSKKSVITIIELLTKIAALILVIVQLIKLST